MFWLKQSTSVVVPFGPFLLNSDAVTLVTNLVGTGSNQTENTTTGIRLSKNGGTKAARHATATASTYDAFGDYLVTLDTIDTGTLGTLRMTFTNGAAFCPVWMDFMVLPANMWNSLFGTGGSIPDAVANAAGGLLTTAAGSLDMDEMNADIEAIEVLVTATAIRSAVGLASANLDTQLAEIEGETDDIAAVKTQTDKLAFTVTNQIDANVLDWKSATAPAMTGDAFARLGAPINASISADIAAIRVDTNTTIPNLIAALNNISSANVKTQALAVFATDTHGEPAQGAPAATATWGYKLDLVYKFCINKKLQTATQLSVYNAAGSVVDHKITSMSDDGTTLTEPAVVSGP